MMIGSPDIDQAVKTAIKFIHVVGNVGSKIGRLSIVASNHTIFFIPKRRRTKPQGTILFIYMPFVLQGLNSFVDQPLFGQLAFGKPDIIVDAELAQILADDIHQRIECKIKYHSVVILPE